jgi:hypothetical protein
MITDIYIEEFLLWSREAVEWGPLCGHSALSEGIRGDLMLSPEELELSAMMRKAREQEKRNAWTEGYRAKKREEDLIGFRQHQLGVRMAWAKNNPAKVLKNAETVRTRRRKAVGSSATSANMLLPPNPHPRNTRSHWNIEIVSLASRKQNHPESLLSKRRGGYG